MLAAITFHCDKATAVQSSCITNDRLRMCHSVSRCRRRITHILKNNHPLIQTTFADDNKIKHSLSHPRASWHLLTQFLWSSISFITLCTHLRIWISVVRVLCPPKFDAQTLRMIGKSSVQHWRYHICSTYNPITFDSHQRLIAYFYDRPPEHTYIVATSCVISLPFAA